MDIMIFVRITSLASDSTMGGINRVMRGPTELHIALIDLLG